MRAQPWLGVVFLDLLSFLSFVVRVTQSLRSTILNTLQLRLQYLCT